MFLFLWNTKYLSFYFLYNKHKEQGGGGGG